MSDEQNLNTLERWGDTLERAVCDETSRAVEQSEGLRQVLYPYAGVWVDHIAPRRSPFNMCHIDDRYTDWVRFAASHYSAMVRLYQAYRKLESLLECCAEAKLGNLEANLLLSAHDATSGFWEHLGSAVDNLGRCFDDAPCLSRPTRGGKSCLENKFESLSYAYDRRTQMIHYALVPLGFEDGTIVFNERHFDDENTDWKEARFTPEWVDQFYIKCWMSTIGDFASAWHVLRSRLKANDVNPPTIPEELLDSRRCLPDGHVEGSSYPPVAQSNATRKPRLGDEKVPYWNRDVVPPPSGVHTSAFTYHLTSNIPTTKRKTSDLLD